MSDNIATMNDKQLRNEVQLLRDELAIIKRKYEDIIYNLDTDNFSSRFVKEQGDMKTAIEVNAEGIKTKVSNEDLNKSLSGYSTIEQTAEKISATVTKEYVTDLINDEFVTNAKLQSEITQTAEEINSIVEANYNDLDFYISSVSQKANKISTRVESVENGQFGDYTLFEQTDDTFLFDGDYMKISSAIMLTDNDRNHVFSIFHNEGNGVSAGRRGTYICGTSLNLATPDPLMIGASNQKVYLYDAVDDNLIATQGWVRANGGGGGGTAKFA